MSDDLANPSTGHKPTLGSQGFLVDRDIQYNWFSFLASNENTRMSATKSHANLIMSFDCVKLERFSSIIITFLA